MEDQGLHKLYKVACVQQQLRPMKKSAFFKVWQDLHANIGTMKPATDLCFECQQLMTQIVRLAHLSEDKKSAQSQQAEVHLEMAKTERSYEQIRECKESMTEDTTPLQMHYSFDYAQQVHFPNNPRQPGPAYFLTARKCQQIESGLCGSRTSVEGTNMCEWSLEDLSVAKDHHFGDPPLSPITLTGLVCRKYDLITN